MDFWAGGRTRARARTHSHSFVHTKQTGGHRIVASPGSTCKLLRRLLIGRPVGQLLGLARAVDQIAAGNSVDFGLKSRATQSRDSEKWRETDEEGKRRATCGFCPDTNSTFPSHSPPPTLSIRLVDRGLPTATLTIYIDFPVCIFKKRKAAGLRAVLRQKIAG